MNRAVQQAAMDEMLGADEGDSSSLESAQQKKREVLTDAASDLSGVLADEAAAAIEKEKTPSEVS